MDFHVQHHARTLALRVPDHLRVGPFVVRYFPDRTTPFANYAIPDDDADPSPADVRALIAAFGERDRLPRLEYLPSRAPLVEAALLAAGFAVENRADVMACEPGALKAPPPVDGLVIGEPEDDAGYREALALQHVAYGESEPPTAADLRSLRSTVASGGIFVSAALDGVTVAAAGTSPAVDGVTEYWGLAVAAAYRDRGIAGAVTAHVTALAFARGCHVVWLEPGEPWIGRIYGRLGYRSVGEKLNISRH